MLLKNYNKFVIIRKRMYDIIFYEDKNGYSEVRSLLHVMEKDGRTNKESRINLSKIVAHIDKLRESGTRVGEKVTKHLDGEIWELRPLKNRILYAYYDNNRFIILTHFVKKTQKTPKREIERAKRYLRDYIERNS